MFDLIPYIICNLYEHIHACNIHRDVDILHSAELHLTVYFTEMHQGFLHSHKMFLSLVKKI